MFHKLRKICRRISKITEIGKRGTGVGHFRKMSIKIKYNCKIKKKQVTFAELPKKRQMELRKKLVQKLQIRAFNRKLEVQRLHH